MKTLAIIPARSGSKGIRNKNIKQLCGLPLIVYTINAALLSNCFDTVMVSTDSQEYANISKQYGAEVPFLRSKNNSNDNSNTWDAVREVLDKYKISGKEFDYVAVLQPTSPLRTKCDIQNAFTILTKNNVSNIISVVEVGHPIQWCFKIDEMGTVKDFAKSPYIYKRRQELEKYYHENGAIYIVGANKIIDKNYNLYEDNCFAYIMNKNNSIDIDDELDFYICETLIKNKLVEL